MLNIGVIGCGYWGPNHIRNFRSLSECQMKLACDLDRRRLAHMSRLYPEIKTTTDFKDLANDPDLDAVVVATPVWSHFELAKKCLAEGKHTFIEKPMASSVSQCKELIELAEKNALTLMVGHTFIYSAPVRKIKEIVDAGDIGELLYISSQRMNLGLFQKDINVAWDLAAHDISILLHLLRPV